MTATDQSRLIAGAMSGTSADGVDVAIVRITGRGIEMIPQLVQYRQLPYTGRMRLAICALRDLPATAGFPELARVGREISLAYADAVKQCLAGAGLGPADLDAIAAHGQTLYHDPPNTIQWLDPALLAAETGCAVVSDFRRADCAAGGQGAPLVPFADYILFRHPAKNRVLLNIGGIANLTWLKAGGALEDVIAFDTGPGNCVIDHICRKHDPSGPGYDPEGRRAGQALPPPLALERLLRHPFFRTRPPRSTDGPAMIELFEADPDLGRADFHQRISAATHFAIVSIQHAMESFLPAAPDELIVSGGGTRNRTIMHHLSAWFAGKVMTTDELGVMSQAKEAIAFALLGAATLDGLPSNVPSVTGARHPVVLGSITPRN